MSTHRPMEGVRILEVAEHTFVPAASAILSDWGAEVIKIEHITRGDAGRGLAATGMAFFGGDVSPILEHGNRGKLSLALDLTKDEGRDILYRLAEISDVFLTNKMPSVRKKLKTDVEDIRAHNPNIIYAAGSGFGARGPDADTGGYDILGFWYHGTSGLGMKAPDSDVVPFMPAPAYGDTIGAMTIAGGISAALFHRERTGEPDVVDVSLMATGMWAMAAESRCRCRPACRGTRWRPAPSAIPRTRSTAATRPRTASFSRSGCCKASTTGRRRASGSGSGVDRRSAVRHRGEADGEPPEAAALVAQAIGSKTLEEWKVQLFGMHGQWSPVIDTLEVADDPQTIANGYLQEVRSKADIPFTLVTTPVQFNGAPAPTSRGPEFNEHGDEILTEKLGLDWETIVDLKVKGVVG